MTDKKILEKYTKVVKYDTWNTYLVIDNQRFCVCLGASKTRAKWFAKMLAIALERLIENEAKCE